MATRAVSDDELTRTVDAVWKAGSQSEAARVLGLSRQTISDRMKEARARGIRSITPFRTPFMAAIEDGRISPAHEVEPTSILDRRITRLTDENSKLKAALKAAHREANTEDVLRDVIGKVAHAPKGQAPWLTEKPERLARKPTPEIPVFMLADWHLGEVVERAEVNGVNEYNLAIAEARAHRAVEGMIRLARKHTEGSRSYAGAVLPLVGDFVSGGLHQELKATDEEEAIGASIIARDWLRDAIKRVAGEFGRVYVPAVAGNHGRNTAKPEFKRYYKKNFDWLIIRLLEADFQDDPRVRIDWRPSNDVHFRLFNETYLLAHGDMLGVKGGDGIIGALGPITRGEVKKSGQSAALGFGYNKLLIGHWHQRLWLPRAIVGNTLKGFDEYAKNALGAKPDRPSQSLFFVHPSQGQTSHWDVYVDDPPAPAREWVSFVGAA